VVSCKFQSNRLMRILKCVYRPKVLEKADAVP